MFTLPVMTDYEKNSYKIGLRILPEYADKSDTATLARYIQRVEAAIAAENSSLSESTVSPEFPMYPSLSDAGAAEAQALIDDFGERLKKIANEAISNLYIDILPFIETDSWTNFRNKIVDGMRDYPNAKAHAIYDFKAIRRKMFEEFREEIIRDIQADIIAENEDLKKQIELLCARNSARFS